MITDKHIVIIGAGMVGLVMANLLAKYGFRVSIVDKSKPDTEYPEAIAVRVSAINKASQSLLSELNIWQQLKSMRMGEYDSMQVWDEASHASIRMDAAQVGEPCLGYIIENNLIQKSLFETLNDQYSDLVSFIIDSPIAIQHSGKVRLELNSGKTLEADLIIGADGAKSWLRQAFGIESDSKDFQQEAVVCTVRTELPHGHTAYQRFLETGPLAFLPLEDPYLSSIVWTTTKQNALDWVAMEDEAFNEALAQAFEYKLGKVQVTGIRAHYSLIQQHAKQYVKPGMALIGDAAHSIHPLAGQGVNLGFADAKVLAEVLFTATQKGRSLSGLHTLLSYQRARKHYNAAVLWSMYGFNLLFSNRLSALTKLREFGMNSIDKQAFIKRMFIRQAMGSNN